MDSLIIALYAAQQESSECKFTIDVAPRDRHERFHTDRVNAAIDLVDYRGMGYSLTLVGRVERGVTAAVGRTPLEYIQEYIDAVNAHRKQYAASADAEAYLALHLEGSPLGELYFMTLTCNKERTGLE